MTEALASKKSKKIEHVCVEEDIDLGEDMPTHNFPLVEIEKESSSSGGSSCSDSDSSSGSDTLSDSDSAVVLNYGNIFRFIRATLWSRLPFTLLSDERVTKSGKNGESRQIYSEHYDLGDRLMLLTRKV
ncbi:hypothetical protein IFM89_031460 [Coptis chinensis]|uniref:Uncharacterized protein n=1 Tax=Coptis chinensis TaxID=261450 RepID=A0A835LNB0_9MAGN|nr:hypothetical protein IFM89_031460 [Coptis chinensis]